MIKNKYLNDYATITTKDNKKYNIKKVRIYVGGKINYYGKQYIITNENASNEILHIVDEIYSLDNNRLRFLSDTINKPQIFDTIEYSPDHSAEKPIRVISSYEDAKTEIISLSDIIKFESDLITYENNKMQEKSDDVKKRRSRFKQLVLGK